MTKLQLIEVHLNDPKIPEGGRLSYAQVVTEDFKDKDKEEAVKVNCCVCNKEHLVKKADTQNADQYWCNHDCYLKQPYPFPVIAPFSKKEKKVTETCSACGGPARGRGFTHTEDCPELGKKTEKDVCPECGGPSQGRGFKHLKPDCSLKTKPYVPKADRGPEENSDRKTCPECGGPSQGRGFRHLKPDCSLKTKPYVPKNGHKNSNGEVKENKESSEKT